MLGDCMSTFVSSFVSISERILPVRALGGEGSKQRGVIPLVANDKADCQLFISPPFFLFWWLVFAAFLSKRRGAGQRELCSWQQLRFWHHLPPNPLPRKGLTSVCMCVHIYPPHLAIHHFSRLILTSSQATFLLQELAFETSSFLPPALDFPDSVWHTVVGGRGLWVETGEDFLKNWTPVFLPSLTLWGAGLSGFFFLLFLEVMSVACMDFFCKSSRKQNRCKLSVPGSLDSW